jgi:DNA-binding transcriptional LysR family regulator
VLPCYVGDRDRDLVRAFELEVHREAIWIVAPTELRRTRPVKAVVELLSACFADNRAALEG